MEASLTVPTATSVRTFPVKLMAENRKLLNDYARLVGGDKVSFTHIIGYAIALSVKKYPVMNSTFVVEDGKPFHVQPPHVNIGLAIDVERRGKRSLLVPNIKAAETLNFAQFLRAYNDLVKRARDNKLDVPDFEGTTVSITNPGMIGTSLSVPRLMPGQAVIVGVGAIGYPSEYYAFSPELMTRAGMSEVMTLTSTYDHRVIQGAESGAFLAYLVELLLGKHNFYEEVFSALGVPYRPFRYTEDSTPRFGAESDPMAHARKQALVYDLIRAFRVRGHLQADVNPLGYEYRPHQELDMASYGLTIWDLDRTFVTGGLGGREEMTLREILDTLRETYTRKVGVEYMHITDPGEKRWLQERIEPTRFQDPLSKEERLRILHDVNRAEAFERFLHTKYVGHKRFSLEGAETVIPMLHALMSDAADQGVKEVVIGMAHRGRLNVLANIMGKRYEAIFNEFEGSIDPNTTQGSGDVKYHLGANSTFVGPAGGEMGISLACNPSHLETVNPIVEGMVRAKQDKLRAEYANEDRACLDMAMPVLIHGDAAFAGQGVVAETLNLSLLRGYTTGGTIHLVINNQIGFTTAPVDARSTTYATDVARMIQAPIFHVNGDDPETAVRVMRLALDYRQVYNKDVVIDLLCYRVHGHNEGDEPTYTQPLLYQKIEQKRTVRKLYTESLLRRGEVSPAEAERMMDDFRGLLQDAFDRTRDLKDKDGEVVLQRRLDRKAQRPPLRDVDTRVSHDTLVRITQALMQYPADFNLHPKLKRQFDRRLQMLETGKVDWGFGEALGFGSLLLEGHTVRVAGQDSRRGTFSHRHAVLYDQTNGKEFIPLNHISQDQARLLIYDSFLSEYAACGFEYGYSVYDPSALVIWEAQFGDFANGAQIIFDQFLSAAEEKWGQRSSLVLLLPHGYEGQGPEHSSARLERFLQLCAEDNMIVANLTTPAQLFHAFRRQVLRDQKKPLVIMSPKSLLRHPLAINAAKDFTEVGFQKVIPASVSGAQVRKVVFCSGKVYYDLLAALEADANAKEKVALVRVEQLYPWPSEDVRAELQRFPHAEAIWAQEEPENMGAWTYLRHRLEADLCAVRNNPNLRLRYAGRPESASPAVGSGKVHAVEHEALIADALSL